MNSSINFQKCSLHNETGIWFDVNQTNPEKKITCKFCITQQSQHLILLEDIQKYIQEILFKLIQGRQEQTQNNIAIIKEIIKLQEEIKIKTIFQVDNNLKILNQEIEIMNMQHNLFSNTVKEVSTDENLFEQYNFILQLNSMNQHIKQLLNKQLENLEIMESKRKIQSQITQIQLNKPDYIDEMIQNLEKQLFKQSKQQKYLCQNHNKEAVMIDLNEQSTIPSRFACFDCISSCPITYTKLEKFFDQCLNQQQQKQILIEQSKNNYSNYMDKQIQFITDCKLSIEERLGQALTQLNSFIEGYSDQLIKEQNMVQKKWQNLSQSELINTANEISNPNNLNQYQEKIKIQYQSEIKKTQEIQTNICHDLKQLIAIFQQKYNQIEMCEEELDIDRITKKKKLVQCQKTVQFACLILKRQISNQSQIKEKCQKQQIQYQQVCTIKQEELCCALSFYHDASLMVVSSKKLIKVFQISNCQFQLIQTLNSHQGNVCCLKFMKKSYRFISGGQDKQIIIWSRDDKQQYFCEQQLKGHSYSITCLELNRSENLIISGSMDDKIKFWILQDEWIQSEIFINHEQPVQALSLSKSEQLLVSCSNNVILLNQVINQGDFQVQQIQKIDLLFPIYRISFINNNIFVFQSSESKLQFYVKENNSLKFFSGQEIQIQPNKQCYQYSPSIYLNEKDLLFFKSGQSINIIKNVNDKQFIVQQSIQLKAIESFIAISEDSQYMGIWDQVSKEIQIRKAI